MGRTPSSRGRGGNGRGKVRTGSSQRRCGTWLDVGGVGGAASCPCDRTVAHRWRCCRESAGQLQPVVFTAAQVLLPHLPAVFHFAQGRGQYATSRQVGAESLLRLFWRVGCQAGQAGRLAFSDGAVFPEDPAVVVLELFSADVWALPFPQPEAPAFVPACRPVAANRHSACSVGLRDQNTCAGFPCCCSGHRYQLRFIPFGQLLAFVGFDPAKDGQRRIDSGLLHVVSGLDNLADGGGGGRGGGHGDGCGLGL